MDGFHSVREKETFEIQRFRQKYVVVSVTADGKSGRRPAKHFWRISVSGHANARKKTIVTFLAMKMLHSY